MKRILIDCYWPSQQRQDSLWVPLKIRGLCQAAEALSLSWRAIQASLNSGDPALSFRWRTWHRLRRERDWSLLGLLEAMSTAFPVLDLLLVLRRGVPPTYVY